MLSAAWVAGSKKKIMAAVYITGGATGIGAAAAALGPPAVLFVNAGIQKLTGIFEMEDEDIDAIIDVNLKGALYTVAEAAAPLC
jgi:short-subunit dehydrogenase involved in D-alanine esterification of teichoic acids